MESANIDKCKQQRFIHTSLTFYEQAKDTSESESTFKYI